jgi:hypothetical protein
LQTGQKRKLDDEPEWSARHAYRQQINQMSVAEAAVSTPLASVGRSLQRHKVRNRPLLPDARDDLVLLPEHTVTVDGRGFVLIDDGPGQNDRILVFATQEQLQRYENMPV